MRVMVFGPGGFLGSAFMKAVPDAVACEADICDAREIARALDQHRPDVVINCAGKTGRPNIDWCEHNQRETALANITGPLVLMNECLARDVLLTHIGSGCIFEGDNGGSGFGESDPPNYFGSYYSRSKISADVALSEFPVLILRLRMPFDAGTEKRNLLIKLTRYDKVLDAQNSLTYVPDFIDSAIHLIRQRATGIFHVVNPGTISPYEIVSRYREIVDPEHQCERVEMEGLAPLIQTGRSNCVLSIDKLESTGMRLRRVDEVIDEALHGLRDQREQKGRRQG